MAVVKINKAESVYVNHKQHLTGYSVTIQWVICFSIQIGECLVMPGEHSGMISRTF